MASKLEMFVRRGIVILAVLLAIALGVLVHGRMSASHAARDASFFDNASAIQGAFRKALGPHPPVIEIVIEADVVRVQVAVGTKHKQHFTLGKTSGYVVAGPQDPFDPDRVDVAFSMSTVPFSDVPELVKAGEEELGAPATRVIIDREAGAKALRFRVVAADGREATVKSPDRSPR